MEKVYASELYFTIKKRLDRLNKIQSSGGDIPKIYPKDKDSFQRPSLFDRKLEYRKTDLTGLKVSDSGEVVND